LIAGRGTRPIATLSSEKQKGNVRMDRVRRHVEHPMAIGNVDVGGRLYVFTTNGGAKVRNSCVIDAHGEQTLLNKTFAVRNNRTIYFYVRHGSPQAYNNGQVLFEDDPTRNFAYTNALEAIATGVAQPRETIQGTGSNDDCYDYSLSKVQRSAGGWCGEAPGRTSGASGTT